MLAVENKTTKTDHVDFAKYNGKLTVVSNRTGDHRTYRVNTVQRGNLKGSRILSMLTGSDNEASYTGFAFIGDYGEIRLWKKFKGTAYEQHAKMLMWINKHIEQGNVEVKFETKCRRCNRTLTEPESIELGIGPICRGEL